MVKYKKLFQGALCLGAAAVVASIGSWVVLYKIPSSYPYYPILLAVPALLAVTAIYHLMMGLQSRSIWARKPRSK